MHFLTTKVPRSQPNSTQLNRLPHCKLVYITHECLEEPEEEVRVEGLVDRDVAGVALDPEEGRHLRPPPRLCWVGDGAEEERASTHVLGINSIELFKLGFEGKL